MKEKIFLVDEDLKIGDRYKSVLASEILLVKTELEVDFTELNSRQNSIFSNNLKREKIDAYIGQALYSAISNLPSDTLSNERFWQWLTLVRFRKLYELRLKDPISKTQLATLLSGKSLANQNRNFFQRIHNLLKIAYPDGNIEDKFTLGRRLLRNQDAITSICDRELGLNEPFIRKHLEDISNMGGKDTQKYLKKLNAQAQVFLPDYL
jgi:hypothetical protein